MSTSTSTIPEDSEPLECFMLPREIRQRVCSCTASAEKRPAGDVFYLWLQVGAKGEFPAIAADKWLNVIDEAASVGVNWLVITLGAEESRVDQLEAMCRWAQDTYDMTVCLHTLEASLDPAIEGLIASMAPDRTYVLVEKDHADGFSHLQKDGVKVGLATPVVNVEDKACEYPYKMVFVDAAGDLYTCGLVAGEKAFFLGSVFSGSLEQIVHNPKLPHSVHPSLDRNKQGCSGCPPLVAEHLLKAQTT